MNKEHTKDLKYIANNYRQLEKSIASQLKMLASHPTTTGSNRELIWMELFKGIVPHKFSVERSVFILDSTGKVSNEVDLAIFDEQYTPYIFRHGNLKYIPIEAVSVVVECKSTSLNLENLKTWCESINHLFTSANSIARIVGRLHFLDKESKIDSTQTGTRPIKILCNMHPSSDQSDFLAKDMFDLVIQGKENKLILHKPKDKMLSYWYHQLNHKTAFDWPENSGPVLYTKGDYNLDQYEIKNNVAEANTVLSLVFVLNQLLMLINNPFFFPHLSYVKLFNEIEQEKIE